MTSANLPKIGIYDWKDIKEIAKGIRMLLTVHVEDWFRSISLPPRESLGKKKKLNFFSFIIEFFF